MDGHLPNGKRVGPRLVCGWREEAGKMGRGWREEASSMEGGKGGGGGI